MANTSRAQDYLMQIVSAGYGFDVPEIQTALASTNYQSVEAAVEYLFANQSKKQGTSAAAATAPNTSSSSSKANPNATTNSAEICELKRRIAKMEIEGNLKMNVTRDIMKIAITKNKNTDDALNYIMDRYSHLIKPNEADGVEVLKNKEDADQYKKQLMEDAMRKKAQQEKQEREREKQVEMERQNAIKAEKEKEEKRRQHRERVALNRSKIANKKKNERSNKKKASLDWHKRHEAYDKSDELRLKEIESRRRKQEEHIDSPQAALQGLLERYDEMDAINIIQMLNKIITNIVKHPQQEKYRKINLQKAKIKDTIVTPLGAMKFLQFLGFEQVIEKDEIFPDDAMRNRKYLVYNKMNENECKQAIAMLNQYGVQKKSIVYEYWNKIKQQNSENNAIAYDALYMAFMYLHTMINNICISPASQHLRVIPIDDDIFKKRVGQYPIFQKLLKQLGYKLDKKTHVKGRVFVLQLNSNEKERDKELRYFRSVTRDLHSIAHDDILMQTSIGCGIHKIYHLNIANLTALYKFFNLLIRAADHILNEPLNMKYQSINVTKLKAKYPDIHGIVSVLKLLGFYPDKIAKTMFVLSDEYNQDWELLKFRKMIFQNVINDKKLLKKQLKK
eukprot:61732_1